MVADYPRELEQQVECADGTRFATRPIRSDDAERLAAFHHRLSTRSTYLRFFSHHPELSAKEIEHFTCVDYDARLALVAEIDGDLIAIGRYDRQPNTSDAEVAFVVADEYQRHGIASLLLDELARAALERGIKAFVATTLSDNRPMLDVFFNSGFHVTSSRDHETVTVRFPIEPDERYRAALAARDASRSAARIGPDLLAADRRCS